MRLILTMAILVVLVSGCATNVSQEQKQNMWQTFFGTLAGVGNAISRQQSQTTTTPAPQVYTPGSGRIVDKNYKTKGYIDPSPPRSNSGGVTYGPQRRRIRSTTGGTTGYVIE